MSTHMAWGIMLALLTASTAPNPASELTKALPCADTWDHPLSISLRLAELHLQRAEQQSAQPPDAANHDLARCDHFLAAVQISLLLSEHNLLSQPGVSGRSDNSDAEMQSAAEEERHSVAIGSLASSADLQAAGGEGAAIRYHWARGLMTQLQGDAEAAQLHLSVCEALCKRWALLSTCCCPCCDSCLVATTLTCTSRCSSDLSRRCSGLFDCSSSCSSHTSQTDLLNWPELTHLA